MSGPVPAAVCFADLAVEIMRRPPRLGRTRLIFVDGPSAAGKTVLAERLAVELRVVCRPEPVPVVATDDLLDGWDDQLTFWPRLERQVLRPLKARQAGHYRPYDWLVGRFSDTPIEVPPAPAVIVEGVSAARASARAVANLTVFVTAPPAVRLARSEARDGEAQRPYLEKWRRREDRHFAADATAARVDLVIDAGDPAGPRLLRRNAGVGP